ncbi:uncharacterized protein BDZ83DRAFT_154598 [Colletotrichum acutatum]|uniref:Uncharacterized protein n=1 Tax=Glomerella acutata TaxID=27357 RepID=A0AAD8X9T0_GLOAC|nr:uncharacterized protein BDZ83DRAFT_154598 [Colletotrichum acutatum]KAK1708679.1 hypothetical protein BDZ83DRAFT_154598 [Colletotrichum acutatum]
MQSQRRRSTDVPKAARQRRLSNQSITLTDSWHFFTPAAEAQGAFSSNVYCLLHRHRQRWSWSSTYAFAPHVHTRARSHQPLRNWRGIQLSINGDDDKHRSRGEGGKLGATVHRDLRRTLVARPRNVCVPLAIPGTEYNQRMAATWQRIGNKAVLVGSNRICGSFGPKRFNTAGIATSLAHSPYSSLEPVALLRLLRSTQYVSGSQLASRPSESWPCVLGKEKGTWGQKKEAGRYTRDQSSPTWLIKAPTDIYQIYGYPGRTIEANLTNDRQERPASHLPSAVLASESIPVPCLSDTRFVINHGREHGWTMPSPPSQLDQS